ncbi:unnamed protein product, partial [Hapterophycus canaliculatus]
EEEGQEKVILESGIRPGMEEEFKSEKYGFRVRVQMDSVPAHPLGGQISGPITVSPLKGTMEFEGAKWEGVLKVECLPSGARFVAPLLFDFPVDAGNENDPIIDSHGKVRYEILTKDRRSKRWVRDPEGAIPLQIVKDDQGQTYVRAHIQHFSIWGLWKQQELDLGPQVYRETKLPWTQRRKHQSVIKNITSNDISIHVYAMRMSQWEAALESVKAGGGVEGFQAEFELAGGVQKNFHAIAKIPQMMTIPSGNSQWLEIPRVGTGLWSSRKAAVVIVTEENAETGGRVMRMEAVVHLRSEMLLEVNLPIKNGKVSGSPAAAESGGILSQVMRVIQNQANALPGKPPSTVGQSRTEPHSAVTDRSCGEQSSLSTATVGSAAGVELAGGELLGSRVMAESKAEEGFPAASATDRSSYAAAIGGTDASAVEASSA